MEIPDPEKFELATVVTKNSKSGITSNKRLLVIKKGYLYYYSSIPKLFKGDPKVLESLEELPKCSIEIASIKQIKGYENNSSYFSIEFDAKHMMEREDIRKTKTLQEFNFAPKNTKEVITWQFTCDNQFVKQRWVSALQTLQTHYSKEKLSIQKYFENVNKKQEQQGSGGRSSARVPWIEDQLKKNGSNSSLSPRNSKIQNRNSKSPQKESSEKRKSKEPVKMSLPQSGEDVVQNFMNLQKVQEEKKLKEEMTVVEEINESSLITPQKTQPQVIETEEEVKKQEKIQEKILEKENLSLSKKKSKIQETQKKVKKKKEKRSNEKANFYEIQSECGNRQNSFDRRLKTQGQMNEKLGEFIKKATETFMNYVNKRKTGNLKEAQKNIQDGLCSLQIEGIRLKVGFVGTQSLFINKKPKIYYNEEIIKNLKKQMKIYQQLWEHILTLSRDATQKNQQMLQMKVPLCSYIQYKGVCCLAYDQSIFKKSSLIYDEGEIGPFQQIISSMGYNHKNFNFWKVDQETILIELKSVKNVFQQLKKKHHNITFELPLNIQFIKKIQKNGGSTSIQSLLKYIKGIKNLNEKSIVGCKKQEILLCLRYCYFCKYLRKIYRAAQGEIDELHFLNLVFKGDTQITHLFESSGFQFQPSNQPIFGLLFDFIKYYLGIECEINQKNLQKFAKVVPLFIQAPEQISPQANIINSIEIQPKVISYTLQRTDLYESINRFQKFNEDQNLQLSKKCLNLKRQVYVDNPFQKSFPWPCTLDIIENMAEIHFMENDFIECTKKCKEFLIICSPNQKLDNWKTPISTRALSIYLLMLKAYSKFSLENFKFLLKETSEHIIYNYGEKSSLLIELFSFAGLSLASLNQQLPALSFMEMASKLSDNENQIKKAQLKLDLARIYFRLNKSQLANQCFQDGAEIIEREGNTQEKINLYLYQLEIVLSDEKSQNVFLECQKVIKKIKEKINEGKIKIQYLESFSKLIFEVGNKYNQKDMIEEAIEILWTLNTKCKVNALRMGIKHIKRQIKVAAKKEVEKSQTSMEQNLYFLEKKKQSYKNIYEMLTEALIDDDDEIMICLHDLHLLEVLKS